MISTRILPRADRARLGAALRDRAVAGRLGGHVGGRPVLQPLRASTGRSSSKVLDRSDGPTRGASTIAMQTVKNLFLWTSRSLCPQGARDPARALCRPRLVEAADDGDLPQRRRMGPRHLRRRGGGPALFQARRPRTLTAGQSALLAVDLAQPGRRAIPAKPTRYMQAHARTVAARARASGAYIDCLYP